MLATGLQSRSAAAAGLAGDAADAELVGSMRLVLSVAVLLAVYIDPQGMGGVGRSTWQLFALYVLHSGLLYAGCHLRWALPQSRLVHWLDVLWYSLIVLVTGGIHSAFFLFFFFAILTASFRFGFEEGARVTCVSGTIYAALGLMPEVASDVPRLLVRTSFIFALGYMIVHWGESKLALRRRLALLREVSVLGNPRFGVDQTLLHLLEKTRQFYKAEQCILVLADSDTATGSYSLRTVRQGPTGVSNSVQSIGGDAAGQLLNFAPDRVTLHSHTRWKSFWAATQVWDGTSLRWLTDHSENGEAVAECIGSGNFISAPVSTRGGAGRLFVAATSEGFSRGESLFLGQIASQAFPMIENIELLDRIASDAAVQERQKIALDIHDTAIQPYIGLNLGLSALRKKAAPGNPLIDEIDKLSEMATEVIADLRRYAGNFRQKDRQQGNLLASVLRQQAEQVRNFYGIEIDVRVDPGMRINDRLAAELLQVTREGLSNICKHTAAQRGAITVRAVEGRLRIDIENEGISGEGEPPAFVPRSITERASALGGRAHVVQASRGGTAVHIEIPL
ncbi:MAG: histidine kinase [Pseudomonadota bacterium]